jgi:hypothetical protein
MSLSMNEVDRADEIVNEMVELLDEFDRICKRGDNVTYERFCAYPKGHIDTALTDSGHYVGSTYPLSTIVESMRNHAVDENEYDDDYEDED